MLIEMPEPGSRWRARDGYAEAVVKSVALAMWGGTSVLFRETSGVYAGDDCWWPLEDFLRDYEPCEATKPREG